MRLTVLQRGVPSQDCALLEQQSGLSAILQIQLERFARLFAKLEARMSEKVATDMLMVNVGRIVCRCISHSANKVFGFPQVLTVGISDVQVRFF